MSAYYAADLDAEAADLARAEHDSGECGWTCEYCESDEAGPVVDSRGRAVLCAWCEATATVPAGADSACAACAARGIEATTGRKV